MNTNQIIELIARAFEEDEFPIPYTNDGAVNEEALGPAIARRIRTLSDFFDPVKD